MPQPQDEEQPARGTGYLAVLAETTRGIGWRSRATALGGDFADELFDQSAVAAWAVELETNSSFVVARFDDVEGRAAQKGKVFGGRGLVLTDDDIEDPV